MSAALVLVDVENIRTKEEGFLLRCRKIPFTSKIPFNHCHIIYVASIHDCLYNQVDISEFEEASTIICRSLKAKQKTFEIILTIDFSESSDRILYQSCIYASDESNAGPFNVLFACTRDRGLKSSICEYFQKKYFQKNDLIKICEKFPLSILFLNGFNRTSPTIPVKLHDAPCSLPGPTVIIDELKKANYIRNIPVQVNGNLTSICNQISQFPALLSQVSMTISNNEHDSVSARGVQRLMNCLRDNKIPLLSWGQGDDLEYELRVNNSERYEMIDDFKCDPSPIGPGVVRIFFKVVGLQKVISARSKLPVFILRALYGNKLPLKTDAQNEINDQEVLFSIIKNGISHENITRTCSFQDFFAELIQPHPSIVQDWWYGIFHRNINFFDAGKVKLYYTETHDYMNCYQFRIKVSPKIIFAEKWQLAWQCIQPEEEYKCSDPCKKYSFFKINDLENNRRFLVYALEDVSSGDTIKVKRIQEIHKAPNRFKMSLEAIKPKIAYLKMFPILVGWLK